MFYRTCPLCGCNLDPGEACSCAQEAREAEAAEMEFQQRMSRRDAQLASLRENLAKAKAQDARERQAAYRVKLSQLQTDLCKKTMTTIKTA